MKRSSRSKRAEVFSAEVANFGKIFNMLFILRYMSVD